MKSLLFIEPLYHQTVKGFKTMTRREGSLKAINDNPDDWELVRLFNNVAKFWKNHDALNEVYLKPRLLVGDIVRLNEPYFIINWGHILYKFDNHPDNKDLKFHNNLSMPAAAARAFVKITSVKCERLLDISDEDCIAEGIEKEGAYYKDYLTKGKRKFICVDHKNGARHSFFSLFKFANKVKEVKNIWVWVYSYVLCDKDGKELTNAV